MKKGIFILLITLIYTNLYAQIRINFPMNRAVFQRNNANEAEVNISGSLSRRVDKVEARFTPINGQGVDDGTWHTIHNNAYQGYFLGKVKVKGGWYRLEVRSVIGNVTESVIVEKVGVGEVFIIAGQSNAQGVEEYGSLGAKDDRVNCVNSFKEQNSINDIRTGLTISQLNQDARIAPSGRTAWCWGELGDKLAQRLNVPILFFNAAWGGTTATNWSESAYGKTTNSLVESKYMPDGFPYYNLKFAQFYYGSLFGVRAILWHQGETDTFPGTTTRDKYFNELKSVIDKSRSDFGNNVTWVISKVSYAAAKTSEEVLAGQQMILNLPNYNTFQGPSTDNIQIPRPDVVHFQNTATSKGISQLADAWDKALNQSLFVNYSPILANPVIDFQLKCVDNKQTNLQIPTPNSIQIWNDQTQSNLRETTTGNYFFAIVKDSKQNIRYTPAFDPRAIDFNFPTPQISSSLSGICEGQTLDLNIIQSYPKYIWNDGAETANTRSITQKGTYSVRGVNGAGCFSPVSNNYNAIVNPNPAQPQISSNNSKSLICDGELVRLTISDTQNAVLWSNGSTARSVDLTKAAEYRLSATVQNQFGCKTTTATTFSVSIKPRPDKPIISGSNRTIVCDGTIVKLAVSDLTNKLIWNDGFANRTREISNVGDYTFTVRAENSFGCQSALSDSVKFGIKQVPAKPKIVTNDPLINCEGRKITLLSSDLVNKVLWSNGSTSRNIELDKVGEYKFSLSVESQFGCKSATSDAIEASIKSSPQKPKIVSTGIFGLKLLIPDSVSINKYEWRLGDKILTNTKTAIYARESGNYLGVTYKIHNLGANQSLTCAAISEIFSHKPVASFQNLVFYPNPTTDKIYLESKVDLKNAILEIYTANGYLYESINLNALDEKKIIDLSKIPKGRYIFRVIDGTFAEFKSVMID